MAGIHAKLYRSDTISDFDVVLISESQREPGPEKETARVVPGHGKSEYFELKIVKPLDARSARTPGRKRLFVQVRYAVGACSSAARSAAMV
jgi:hypothetical protein